MAVQVKDMTKGPSGRLIIGLALPLMLGNVCQQLYTMVDTMIVGQIVGVEALAALGAGEWILWLVLGISTGMTQGFGIMTAQQFGGEDGEGLRKTVARSYVLTGILAAVVLILSELLAPLILKFLDTPENIRGISLLYLRIAFCGIPVIAAYNVFSTVLRSLGNSRVPLYAMLIAAAVNVGLDLLFVAVLGWGVAGAAAATVAAQSFSAVFCLGALKKIEIIKLTREDFAWQYELDKKLLKLGAPVVFQNMVISIGGMVVQHVVNGYGFLFVAGFTATNKLYGILEMAAISYGYAIVSYTGQNLGAQRTDRILEGVRAGSRIAFVTSLAVSAVMFLLGRKILGLFISGTPDETAQVLAIAWKYLSVMAGFLWILYFLYVYRSALQGLGDTVLPMVSGGAEFVMRVSAALLLPKLVGENGIFYAEIMAWSGAAVLLAAGYYIRIRKLKKYLPV